MNLWPTATLRDVTSRITKGTTPTTIGGRFTPDGIAFVKVESITADGRINPAKLAFIDEDTNRLLVRSVLAADDLLFSIAGTVGRVARVAERDLPANTNQALAILRPNKDVVDVGYLLYCLKDEARVDRARTRIVQSVQANLSLSELADMELPLPPILEQRGISATLGALDDKIESNRREIALLDALFHSHWQLLYDERCRTEVLLGDVVTTQYGLTASAGSDPSGVKFLRVTDINKTNWLSWRSIPTVTQAEAGDGKYHLQRGDLLVARMADPGKSALYDDDDIPAVFASYLVRLHPRTYDEGLFLFGFLKSRHYLDYAAGAMTGSVQKNMNARLIVDTRLRWPDPADLKEFAAGASSIRGTLNAKLREITRLSTLRDTLLPELLTGRVRVPEAFDAVEEVSA